MRPADDETKAEDLRWLSSIKGAEFFMVIRSVLSTAQKRELNLLKTFIIAAQGQTPAIFSS